MCGKVKGSLCNCTTLPNILISIKAFVRKHWKQGSVYLHLPLPDHSKTILRDSLDLRTTDCPQSLRESLIDPFSLWPILYIVLLNNFKKTKTPEFTDFLKEDTCDFQFCCNLVLRKSYLGESQITFTTWIFITIIIYK